MIRSVEAGPCPECDYTFKAHPAAETAMCPRCAESGVGSDNSDTPRVEVPDRDG
jgi:predicted Zn-ribbon and HTH transcriptional regulator